MFPSASTSIYIIKYIVQSFKMPILHRVQNGQSKFLTMKPKTHKKVQKKKISFPFLRSNHRDSIIPPNCAEEKKRRYPARHSRAQNSTLSQRERERKKERKKDGRTARVVVVVQARGGGSFFKRELKSRPRWCPQRPH